MVNIELIGFEISKAHDISREIARYLETLDDSSQKFLITAYQSPEVILYLNAKAESLSYGYIRIWAEKLLDIASMLRGFTGRDIFYDIIVVCSGRVMFFTLEEMIEGSWEKKLQ